MLGPLIADGSTSSVYRWGTDRAVKILKPSVPARWARSEEELTRSVSFLEVGVPDVLDLIDVDGRPGIVFGYVPGPSMWQAILDRPDDIEQIMAVLVDLQFRIHAAGLPGACPGLRDRLARKIGEAVELGADEIELARRELAELPAGAALLHGDLHPGNVLMGPAGPVVIDWFDAAIGHPSADIARTRLLLRATGGTDLLHLPGITPGIASAVASGYERAVAECSDLIERSDAWLPIVAAGRLAERTDTNVRELTSIWRSSRVDESGQLLEDAGR